MSNRKDIWIDEVMAIATDKAPLKPERDLFADIMTKIDEPQYKTVSKKIIFIVAILFLALNIVAVISINNQNKKNQGIYADTDATSILTDYNLYN